MEENRQKSNREVLYYERVYYLTAYPDVHSKFLIDNPNPNIWTDKMFKDYNMAITILDDYNKSMWKGYEMSLSDFMKYYACDLDWAKDTQYCKVTPEPPKPGTTILVTDQSEKLKKFENYSCLTSSNRCKLYSVVDDVQGLIYYMGCTNSDTGQFAKYYDDGLVVVYDVVFDDKTGKRILNNPKQTTYKCPEVKADEVQPE